MHRKKFIFSRLFLGFCVGTAIGTMINILVCAVIGTGKYQAAMPLLAARCSTELNAAVAQFLMCGIIGSTFAIASLLFEIERWGFLKQCIVHFFATASIYLPFIYLCWQPLHTAGLLSMLGNILFTYTLTWWIQYRVNCKNVAEINRRLREVRHECD